MIKKLFLAVLFSFYAGSVWAMAVNVNTADAQQLADLLSGVGPAKAQAIIEYREQHGEFKSLADLQKVQGIGPRTIEMNVDNIVLSD